MLKFMPGCNIEEAHPAALEKIRRYMEKRGAQVVGCCKEGCELVKPGDELVYDCTLCHIILKERCPDAQLIMLHEFVLDDPGFPWCDHHRERITIQDCWKTRDERSIQEAARECLRRMNFEIVEAAEHGQETQFCGAWRHKMPGQKNIDAAPKTFADIIENHIQLLDESGQKALMEERVQSYETERVAVYCGGCERGLKLGGGEPVALVELLAEGL